MKPFHAHAQFGAAIFSLAVFMLTGCTTPAPDVANAKVEPPVSEPGGAHEPETKTVPNGQPAAEPKPAVGSSWENDFGSLLSKYVTSGGVRYAAWKGSPSDLSKLKSVVDAIAAKSASGSEKERLAYYLNAYNAWILHLVLEDYPIKGVGGGHPLGRNAFFGRQSLTVGGKKMSFNDLEHETVRKQFAEPRIHFALNCASAGCPPLMNRPFRASTLDADLTRLTRSFVNQNTEGVRKTPAGSYSLSEIFSWFKEDFGDVVTFINRYRTEPIPSDATIEYHDYDWSLNAAG